MSRPLVLYPLQIGFRFSEPDFNRAFDFSQTHALKFLKPLRNGYIKENVNPTVLILQNSIVHEPELW